MTRPALLKPPCRCPLRGRASKQKHPNARSSSRFPSVSPGFIYRVTTRLPAWPRKLINPEPLAQWSLCRCSRPWRIFDIQITFSPSTEPANETCRLRAIIDCDTKRFPPPPPPPSLEFKKAVTRGVLARDLAYQKSRLSVTKKKKKKKRKRRFEILRDRREISCE